MLGQPKATCSGGNVSLDQRIAAAIGPQQLDALGGASVRLKEQRVQRLKAGGFAMLIGGAEHVDAFANAFDGNATTAEPLDVMQTQGVELHGAIASQ